MDVVMASEGDEAEEEPVQAGTTDGKQPSGRVAFAINTYHHSI